MSVSNPRIGPPPPPPVETAGDERARGGAETAVYGASGRIPGAGGGARLAYGVVAAVTLAFLLVNALSAADEAVRRGEPYRLDQPLFFESTSAVATLLMLPLMRRGIARVRAGRNWPARTIRAAATAMLFAAGHILFMVALRKLATWAVGSSYAFDAISEVPYEMRKDLVSALLIGLAFWVLDRPHSPADPAAVPASEAAAALNPLLWLRDGASSVRIDAREVIWVASAGNYVEYALPARRHLVRGTLAGEEARLLPFGVVRVHRTRLVNLSHVVALESRPSGDFALRMDSGEVLAGSRRYRHAVAALQHGETQITPIA